MQNPVLGINIHNYNLTTMYMFLSPFKVENIETQSDWETPPSDTQLGKWLPKPDPNTSAGVKASTASRRL